MIGGMGIKELLVILLVAIVIFGAGRIPKIAEALGKGIREFKRAGKDIVDDVKSVPEQKPKEKSEGKTEKKSEEK